jgi:hypothetical protein
MVFDMVFNGRVQCACILNRLINVIHIIAHPKMFYISLVLQYALNLCVCVCVCALPHRIYIISGPEP